MQAVLPELAARASAGLQAGRIGIAFPSVIKHGVARTAANIDSVLARYRRRRRSPRGTIGRPVLFLNDADAAGPRRDALGRRPRLRRGRHHADASAPASVRHCSVRRATACPTPNSDTWSCAAWTRRSAPPRRCSTVERLRFPETWSARVNEYLAAPAATSSGPTCSSWGVRSASASPSSRQLLALAQAQLRPAHFAGNQAGVVGAALAAAESSR
jgi:hypothetical protein